MIGSVYLLQAIFLVLPFLFSLSSSPTDLWRTVELDMIAIEFAVVLHFAALNEPFPATHLRRPAEVKNTPI